MVTRYWIIVFVYEENHTKKEIHQIVRKIIAILGVGTPPGKNAGYATDLK